MSKRRSPVLWAVLGLLALAGLGGGGFLIYDVLVPRRVERTLELSLDDGGTLVVWVRWRRVLGPDGLLEVRDAAGELVRDEPLPADLQLDLDALTPGLQAFTLLEPVELVPDWLTGALPADAPPPSRGTCVVSRRDGQLLFCAEHTARVDGRMSAGDAPADPSGLLLELHGPSPHTLVARRLRGGALAWSVSLDSRWDPPGSDTRAWFVGRYDAPRLRVGERLLAIDPDRGSLRLASPEDATDICTDGMFIAALVGDALQVARLDALALRTLATPGAGRLERCSAFYGLRPGEDTLAIRWCPRAGAEACTDYVVTAALDLRVVER